MKHLFLSLILSATLCTSATAQWYGYVDVVIGGCSITDECIVDIVTKKFKNYTIKKVCSLIPCADWVCSSQQINAPTVTLDTCDCTDGGTHKNATLVPKVVQLTISVSDCTNTCGGCAPTPTNVNIMVDFEECAGTPCS